MSLDDLGGQEKLTKHTKFMWSTRSIKQLQTAKTMSLEKYSLCRIYDVYVFTKVQDSHLTVCCIFQSHLGSSGSCHSHDNSDHRCFMNICHHLTHPTPTPSDTIWFICWELLIFLLVIKSSIVVSLIAWFCRNDGRFSWSFRIGYVNISFSFTIMNRRHLFTWRINWVIRVSRDHSRSNSQGEDVSECWITFVLKDFVNIMISCHQVINVWMVVIECDPYLISVWSFGMIRKMMKHTLNHGFLCLWFSLHWQ